MRGNEPLDSTRLQIVSRLLPQQEPPVPPEWGYGNFMGPAGNWFNQIGALPLIVYRECGTF